MGKETQSEGKTKELLVRRDKRAKQAQRLCEPERDTEKPAGPRNGPSSWLPSLPGSGPVCVRLENPFIRWPRQDSKEPRGTQESTEVFSTEQQGSSPYETQAIYRE